MNKEQKAVILDYAQELQSNDEPWREFEISFMGKWQMCESYANPVRFLGVGQPEFRRKPMTITAGGLEWSGTLLGGKAVNYEAASAAVEALGEGWRLPTRFELESLLDLSRHDPAIDTEKYPDTKSTWYWTSSKCAWNEAAVWVVAFYLGFVYNLRRDYNACVRAVKEQGE